jgi:hypothetical protein
MYSFIITLEQNQNENTKYPFYDAKSHILWLVQAKMIIADYPISFYTLKESQILVQGDG